MKDFKEIYKNNAKLLGTDDLHYGRQLYLFLERNKVSSKDLYDLPYSELGKTFVECPLTKARMIMIKENYIKNILGMTKEEYLRRYPDVILIAESRVKNIKKGIHKIDPETGLTIHQKAINKASKTLKQVGDDGLTGYKKLGMKTKNTHMNNIDENGLNGYQRLAKFRNETILDNGLSIQQNAVKKVYDTMTKNGTFSRKASKKSIRILQPIIDLLNIKNVKYYFDNTEYSITGDDNNYYFDLVIPDINLCIEYQSKAYHPSIYLTEDEWNNWRPPFGEYDADEKYHYDINKAKQLYDKRGFCTWFVWEHNEKKDVRILLDWIRKYV